METKEATKQDAKQVCDEFNSSYPRGTLVEYWSGEREGHPTGITTTRSNAWPLCSKPSILLVDVLGDFPLTHINVIVDRDQL